MNWYMGIVEAFIKKHGMSFSQETATLFSSIFERKEYAKDEVILAQGQTSHHMYYVEKGMLRQYYYKEGRDITEHFSTESNLAICLESIFLKEPTNLIVEAIEPTVVYLLDYTRWKQLSEKNTEINRLLIQILEMDLVESQRKADSWRFENSQERYSRFCKEYPEVVKRAPVAHIATYLLMTPETLSRVRAGSL